MGKKNRQPMNNGQSSKKDEIERLKALATKNREQTEEERKQAIIEKFGLENAEIFMKQEEILSREDAVASKEQEVERQQKDIAKKEEEIEKKTAEVKEEEQKANERIREIRSAVEEQEKQLKAIKKEIADREKAIETKENELLNVERNLIQRENNAENDFAIQNKKALEVLRKRTEELQEEILALEQKKIDAEIAISEEISQLRIKKTDLADSEAKAYYEARKKEMDSKLAQMEQTGKDKIAQDMALLDEQKKALSSAQKEMNKSKIDYEEKLRNLENREEELRFQARLLEEDKKTNQRVIEEEVEAQVDLFRGEMQSAQDSAAYYKKQAKALEERVAEFERLERESDGNSVEDLLRMIDSLKGDIKKLKKEKGELPEKALFLEYESKAKLYDALQRELTETRTELYDLQNEKQQWMKTTNQLEIERENCKYLEKRREALEATIVKYGEEVNRFKSLYEQPKELAARLDAIKKPILEKKMLAELNLSEMEWLDKIYDNCVESDIQFNKRLLYSFHTALKTADWSPLTVLAGVSGTGKSILPEYYARYGGLYFMSMAVQPDWDSPQALFGYFNSVDNRFNATTLLRAMVQFSNNPEEIVKDSNLSDTMFLVLLDEMNLAHVELYFSDMLSKLERRRNTNDDICVEIDLGAGMDKYQLELNDNVLWVGTMNEDETTKSLSDKVLDRGNLISFPRPKEFMSRKKIHNSDPAPMLSKTTWNEWLSDTVIEDANFVELVKKYKKGLEEVNEAMGNAGRALGHRVWQSIENYMANHPLVIEAFRKNPNDKAACDKALEGAFEEALVHKVMPKLRGIETDGSMKTQCIDRIKNVLFGSDGIANGLYADFESAINNTYETFLWSSAAYLDEE